MVAVAVDALLVEPVHPAEGFKFELIDVVPCLGGVGSVRALGFVQSVRCLCQGVVI